MLVDMTTDYSQAVWNARKKSTGETMNCFVRVGQFIALFDLFYILCHN